jgi:malonate-semialdehyde dehydrogenase (acetylating) / methylmalonate-semialdehyde dehydrogenase
MANKRKAEPNGANWIDNTSVLGTGQTIKVLNPCTGKVIQDVYSASPEQVEQAIKSSQEAFVKWSARTVKDRVQFLIRYHQLVIKNKDKLADLIVLEHGKTKEEALAEVAKGNETVEFALSLPQLILGNVLEVSRGFTLLTIRYNCLLIIRSYLSRCTKAPWYSCFCRSFQFSIHGTNVVSYYD